MSKLSNNGKLRDSEDVLDMMEGGGACLIVVIDEIPVSQSGAA